MGRLGQNYRNSRSTSKQAKQLEKSNSSPIKESNKICYMNSKIEKQAKKNLNEIDSYENLMSANNNFLQDLYNDQSTKNARMSSELSGWQNSEPFHKQADFQDRQARFDNNFTTNNESNIISDRQSKRAISANFNIGQTPLVSRRKIIKHQNDQSTYGSSQKQSKNDISSEFLPQAAQQTQSCNQKINSFSSPQVLLSTFIGSSQKFNSSQKQNQDQYVSPFEINSKQFEQNDQQAFPSNNQQGLSQNNQDNILKNTVSEWKNYLDRYDSSQDLYNVHLKKRRTSLINQHEAQLSEEKQKDFNAEEIGESDRNNVLNQLLRQNKLKNIHNKSNNLSIDISQIRISASNNQSFVEDSQQCQQQLQTNNGYQVNSQYPTNYNSNNQKELSSRNTYRTSKSSQANRIFGKKKKSRIMNMSAVHSNQNTLMEYQINNQLGKTYVSKNTLFNSLIEENQISSSSLIENQNKVNLYQLQPQNISNSSSQTVLKQKNNQNTQPHLTENNHQASQFVPLNPNISSNAYHPQEFFSSKNTLACIIQGNQCTTPQNKYLENQDLKSVFYQILNKTKEEKEVLVSNKSQILKSVSNNYQPKRSQNFSSANAAYHLGKEKIKQVIQQKNNQIALKQQQNTLNNNTQALNSNQNQVLGYQSNFCNNNLKQVAIENNLFKMIRNNKELIVEDQSTKNNDKVEKFIHLSNTKYQNQIIVKQKQQDENNSQPNHQKIRAKSVINNEQPENLKPQDHQAIFSNKKYLYEQANRILKPTVQNILAVSNENNTNNHFKTSNINNYQQVKFLEKQPNNNNNNNNNNLRELNLIDKKVVSETKTQRYPIHSNILPIKL
ncbi:endo-1,4-beta-xylanase xylA, putative (macronuclear) [Tetrahymena thermophila SB210]|uniref:Endo-1,4-beta-xylanase xylA, putative n=1 Tax=Tetrahymena thermophila (strain SB210) TaxID=312017 RepID=I7MK10_TETTS|nr:endo-1,4-beta-xylanase xylA, putative [Tetrahymena thermophila SB210]EAS07724.2 endo-1,4-beta-xylanase xylA, putative [Tetrahymena thermophila SB210]|eukprot:XP_001027966.2 endo-1,4-beta-xylanase xylA, putative [Tetrahymena thermophila SB210]